MRRNLKASRGVETALDKMDLKAAVRVTDRVHNLLT